MGTTKHKGFQMVLSVLIAIIIWTYVGSVVNRTESGTIRNLPVVFTGLETLENRGLIVTDGLNQTVTLNVTGNRDAFRMLSAETMAITVDVSSVQQPGQYTQAYRIAYNFPPTVSTSSLVVTDRYPLNVTFTVAKLERRTVPVRGAVAGSVAEGYQAGAFSFSPAAIEVWGEASVVNQIDYALVTINQEDMTETFNGDLPYTFVSFVGEPVDASGLETDYSLINTTLPIVKLKKVDLSVNLIPGGGITAENMDRFVTCEITPENITVSGPEAALESLREISLGDIDLSKLLSDETLSFPIPLASELTNVSGVSEATVKISLRGLTTATIEVDNIELVNKPEGYEAESVTTSRQIQIRGTEEAVAQVTESQVMIVADLKNAAVSTGTQTIPVYVYLNGVGDVGVVGEYTIVVSISRQ